MFMEDCRIIVRTQFEGLHLWADAPDEVGYLRSQHRHIFKVEATISVTHDDRELEFIMVQHTINDIISEYVQNKLAEVDGVLSRVNLGSCEMMCRYIITKLAEKYGHRYYDVKVFEDGENGGQLIVDMRGKGE